MKRFKYVGVQLLLYLFSAFLLETVVAEGDTAIIPHEHFYVRMYVRNCNLPAAKNTSHQFNLRFLYADLSDNDMRVRSWTPQFAFTHHPMGFPRSGQPFHYDFMDDHQLCTKIDQKYKQLCDKPTHLLIEIPGGGQGARFQYESFEVVFPVSSMPHKFATPEGCSCDQSVSSTCDPKPEPSAPPVHLLFNTNERLGEVKPNEARNLKEGFPISKMLK
ncbi:hypothetical protein L596_010207 [Steinernema carpocapsae]|uniref:Uncharacterized protein n=1 Tax=Steinernema carpocapsae TaxID=34508 RepID=A0A4V6A6U8_STECR|nr:hypothetical protein L596_010207 [Steinernema carpocapsae]